MATALAKKVEEAQERTSAVLARARQRAAAAVQAQQHTVIAAGTAYAIGAMEKRGTELPTIEGVDPKLVYGVAALVAANVVKDKRMKAIAQSAGDGLLAIVAYNQGRGISSITPTAPQS